MKLEIGKLYKCSVGLLMLATKEMVPRFCYIYGIDSGSLRPHELLPVKDWAFTCDVCFIEPGNPFMLLNALKADLDWKTYYHQEPLRPWNRKKHLLHVLYGDKAGWLVVDRNVTFDQVGMRRQKELAQHIKAAEKEIGK